MHARAHAHTWVVLTSGCLVKKMRLTFRYFIFDDCVNNVCPLAIATFVNSS